MGLMLQSEQEFRSLREWAKSYEIALSKYLRAKCGGSILATYDYSGLGEDKPPKLYGVEADFVIPDLLWFRNGQQRWFECKWKKGASPWPDKISKEIVTGFNLRHWNHYWAVQRETAISVSVIFIHAREKECLWGDLYSLQSSIDHTQPNWGMHGNKRRPPMIYFVCRKLRKFCDINALEIYRSTTPG